MEKKEITIPETLDDLTLEQWVKIMDLTKMGKVEDEFMVRTILNVVYGIRGREVDAIRGKDMDMLIDQYYQVVKQKPVFKMRFTLHDVEYGFIPNLDNITAGELADLDTYSKKTETLHKVMAVLFRPIKNKYKDTYQIEPYSGGHELFNDMPLGIALGAQAFFFDLGMELTNAILESLGEDNPQLLNKALEKSGVGINQLTPLQGATYYDLMMSKS